MAKAKKSGLGRGLGDLMGSSSDSASPVPVLGIPVSEDKKEEASSSDSAKKKASKPAEKASKPVEEAPQKESKASEKRSDAQTGEDYLESEQAAEAAEKAPVMEREAKPAAAKAPQDEEATIKYIVNRDAKSQEEVPLASIVPNPDQPRTNFNKEELEELANSIETEGLLQPILVRKIGDTYQIIAGERRYQACKQLGLKNVPVRIMDATDDKAVELALVENIQRADLNPIEEAYGYKRLMERRGLTQSEVAQAVSKGRSTIANALRLLDLPEEAQQLLYEEKITAGHARAILSIPTAEGRQKLTDKLKNEQLSVREAESIARLISGVKSTPKEPSEKEAAPAYFKSVARSVRERLKTNVRIHTVRGKNKLEIEFADEEDLKRMLSKLLDDEYDES